MVVTQAGYIGINNSGNMYFPNNATYAGTITGNNSASFAGISQTNEGFFITPDNRLVLYPNLYQYLQPTSSSSPQTYSLAPNPDATILSDKSGSNFYIDPNTISYSANGQWMVVMATQAILRINLQTLEIVPFAPNTGLSDTATAISDDGRYAAVHANGLTTPLSVYDLSTCGTPPDHITTPVSCQSRDINSYVANAVPGYAGFQRIRFADDNLMNIKAYGVKNGANTIAQYNILAPGQTTGSLQYLALGDSYSSGEGAGNYLRGTNEPNYNMCHASLESYPDLISQDLSYSANTMQTIACSGAVTDYVMNDTQYPKLPPNNLSGNWLPGFEAQIRHVQETMPGITTITMGGNDIGFKKIVVRCVFGNDTCYSTYEERLNLVNLINSKFTIWKEMYKTLLNSAGPGSRLYVIGYPQIVASNGNCALNVHLNGGEIGFSQALISYLNYVIDQAAQRAGATYVDTENALDGHRLCETNSADVAVNGLTIIRDNQPISQESYHPNLLGQQLMAKNIMNTTGQFTLPTSLPGPNPNILQPTASDSDPQLSAMLNAPHGSVPITSTEPLQNGSNNFINNILIRGQAFNYQVNGLDYGLKPNSPYAVMLHSTPVSLGTYMSDANGNLTISTTIPDTVTAGVHMIDITGQDLSNDNIDLFDTAYVEYSSTDYNGDGIPNSSDPCEYFPFSGVDTNQNGIDDACDAYIGIAPLYRARNGNSAQGEDPNLIYIDRNSNIANSIGVNDYNPNNVLWVTIAHTILSDDATSSIANFKINDVGYNAANIYDRYVPILSTRTPDNGCVALTPVQLAPITSSSGIYSMKNYGTNTDTCRSQPSSADVDNDGYPDNQQPLYRARNGNALNGEDPTLIYIERNNVAAEAILGISDWHSSGDTTAAATATTAANILGISSYFPSDVGWSVIGITNSSNTGLYSSLVLVDSSTNQIIASNGQLTQNSLDTMTTDQLRQVEPEVLFSKNTTCIAVIPSDLSVVKASQTRTTQPFSLLTGQACNL
ncbi:MAG TPA: SGNH/GDSL hydrolase family protein [Candidatus Dormibacteraeota bacterium]|nr:SGNH/GDSL hydrolase family protein [Candidatus Dormibacteraeota bacterium]